MELIPPIVPAAQHLRPGWQRHTLHLGGWLMLSVAMGAVGGLMVWWLHDPDDMLVWLRRGFWAPFDPTRKPWEPVVRGVGYAVVLCISLLLAKAFTRRYIPLRSGYQAAAHVAVLSAFSGVAFSLVHLFFQSLPDSELLPPPSPWLIAGVAFSFSFLISTVWYTFDFLRRLRQAERAALEAELRALRAQVHPHFLFNALNTIVALIRTRPAEAEEVTEELADLFRYVLRASRQPTVSLAEELKSVEMYLAIEKARFGDRLKPRLDIPPALHGARVPSLILQPLVENAVKHGASRVEGECAIEVEGRQEGDRICLRVSDGGPGFASILPEAVFGSGTGLANVRDRLHLHFGTGASVQLRPDGVELVFPRLNGPVPAPPAVVGPWTQPAG
jgi:signal transduction histidine kinase